MQHKMKYPQKEEKKKERKEVRLWGGGIKCYRPFKVFWRVTSLSEKPRKAVSIAGHIRCFEAS